MRVAEGAEVTANALFDRTKEGFGALGPRGRRQGRPRRDPRQAQRRRASSARSREVFGTVSASKFTNIRLTGGDEVLIDSPGGGGFGDPRERRPRRASRATSTRASCRPRPRASSTATRAECMGVWVELTSRRSGRPSSRRATAAARSCAKRLWQRRGRGRGAALLRRPPASSSTASTSSRRGARRTEQRVEVRPHVVGDAGRCARRRGTTACSSRVHRDLRPAGLDVRDAVGELDDHGVVERARCAGRPRPSASLRARRRADPRPRRRCRDAHAEARGDLLRASRPDPRSCRAGRPRS